MITQNRQTQMADRRHQLDLQINMLTEQENTKMLAMLERIQARLGIREEDPDLEALAQPVRPEKVVEEIRQSVEGGG